MQEDNFLPEDYKVPAGSSNYYKLQQGENIFRCLSNPIMGWEWWTSELTPDGKEVRTPHRVSEEGKVPMDIPEPENVRHFWALVVWNYADKKVQILEITQKGIQRAISALARSKGWGDPRNYDISVTKSGEKLDTEYSVMPIPPALLDKEIEKKYKETKIDLTALYRGEDPFGTKKNVDVAFDPKEAEEVLAM